jgi:hypothetical protein
VAEFPLLIDHSRADGTPYGLAFVNVWDDPLTYREFLADYPADILSVTDLDGTLPDLYGLDLIPVSMLVNPQGRIELIQVGPMNEAALALADELSRPE